MLANVDEQLHNYARRLASELTRPDKKQLRFNDIVACAKRFYPHDTFGGVRDLVEACDRDNGSMYAGKVPMWETLQKQYSWMLEAGE